MGAAEDRRRETFGKPRQREVITYAVIAFASLIVGLYILHLMLRDADRLVRLGLVGSVFYVLLIPLGLAVAIFLFGVLRSYASLKGKQGVWLIELGGPVVVFVLVVVGGSKMPNPTAPFAITVYVHGAGGRQDVVLENTGLVTIDLEDRRDQQPIGHLGQARFNGIPATFRDRSVPIRVDARGFETQGSNTEVRLAKVVYLPVRRQPGRLAGEVVDEDGKPLADVSVHLDGLETRSDREGRFSFTIAPDEVKDIMELKARLAGYQPYRLKTPSNAGLARIVLRSVRGVQE